MLRSVSGASLWLAIRTGPEHKAAAAPIACPLPCIKCVHRDRPTTHLLLDSGAWLETSRCSEKDLHTWQLPGMLFSQHHACTSLQTSLAASSTQLTCIVPPLIQRTVAFVLWKRLQYRWSSLFKTSVHHFAINPNWPDLVPAIG